MELVDAIKKGKIDEAELTDYITSNNLEVAIAAAGCSMATEFMIDIAAHDRDREVRLAAVLNKNIGNDTIVYLCNDKDGEIADIAKREREKRGI